MKHLWIPNVFVYNLVSFKALDCLQKLAGLWIVKDRDILYNQVGFGFVRMCEIINNQVLRVTNNSTKSRNKYLKSFDLDMTSFMNIPLGMISGYPRHFHVPDAVQQVPVGRTHLQVHGGQLKLRRYKVDQSKLDHFV